MAVATAPSEAAAVVERIDASAWRSISRGLIGFGFRQSVAYCEALGGLRGASNEYVLVRRGGKVLGGACVRVKRAPLPGAGLAYVSFGPLLGSAEDLEPTVRALAAEYVASRGLALRIAPVVAPAEDGARAEAVFAALGFGLSEHAPRYRTILVDLAPEAEAIRRALAQKWRNQLNGAERQESEIRVDRSADAVEAFRPMFEAMLARKGFDTELGPSFYSAVQRSAPEDERLAVGIARCEGVDVAGVVMDFGRETATYILGATTEAGMKRKAAYALHWRMMMDAKARGCRWYDLGGIDPEGNPGVHHFKCGFGGVEVWAPGPFDLRPAGVRGLIGRTVESLYRRRKRWRRSRA